MNQDFKKQYEEQMRKALANAKSKTDATLNKLSQSINTGVPPVTPTPELSQFDSNNIDDLLATDATPDATPDEAPTGTGVFVLSEPLYAELKQQNIDLGTDLANANEAIDSLNNEIVALRAENERLKQAIIALTATPVTAPSAPAPVAINTKAQVTRNTDKDGIEIRFSDKPSDDVILSLRANGFLFSNKQKMWYSRFTIGKYNFARGLVSNGQSA